MTKEIIIPDDTDLLETIVDFAKAHQSETNIHYMVEKDEKTFWKAIEELNKRNPFGCSCNVLLAKWENGQNIFEISISPNECRNCDCPKMFIHYISINGNRIFEASDDVSAQTTYVFKIGNSTINSKCPI